jgi:hypothetical protein
VNIDFVEVLPKEEHFPFIPLPIPFAERCILIFNLVILMQGTWVPTQTEHLLLGGILSHLNCMLYRQIPRCHASFLYYSGIYHSLLATAGDMHEFCIAIRGYAPSRRIFLWVSSTHGINGRRRKLLSGTVASLSLISILATLSFHLI